MRDMAGKIAELKFEAPLARFEEEDTASLKNMNLLTEQLLDASLDASFGENCNANDLPPSINHPQQQLNHQQQQQQQQQQQLNHHQQQQQLENGTDIMQEGTFSPFSGSLEDLVNTFDEKITSCFRDYGTDVESLAPVQVRTQEEIMNECQMWWTITGTFGNILPIDWSKSYARKMHMPALNLNETVPVSVERPELEDLSSEDEAVATDLDMHALILSSSTDTHSPEEPLKTAEEVLREIDDIMQESPSMERSPDSDGSLLDTDEALERSREVLGSPLYEKKLKQLSSGELTGVLGEMEALVGALSETLIAELALRDELEFEKELKNQFISLLLAVQNRRRQHHVTKNRQMPNGTSPLPQHRSFQESKYLTTVIPYHTDNGPPNNQALQVLIKILKAINEDSPTVPTLLTDYILKVLCPT